MTSPALALTANVRYVVVVNFNTGFTGLPCGVNGQGNKYWVQLLQP